MNREQMLVQSRLLLQQGFRSTMDSDPFSEDKLLDQAADKMATDTDCFYRRQSIDLVANQSEYCSPFIYKPTGVFSLDNEGNEYELGVKNLTAMNNMFGNRYWTQWNSSQIALYAVQEGMNRWRIAPIPSTNITAGLIFEGWAKTTDSNVTEGQPFHLWPNPTDECPLPQEAHMGVVYWNIFQRCLQIMVQPEYMATMRVLSATYQELYNEERGRLESMAANRHQMMRRGDLRGRYV